jgi:hypothetical protein
MISYRYYTSIKRQITSILLNESKRKQRSLIVGQFTAVHYYMPADCGTVPGTCASKEDKRERAHQLWPVSDVCMCSMAVASCR